NGVIGTPGMAPRRGLSSKSAGGGLFADRTGANPRIRDPTTMNYLRTALVVAVSLLLCSDRGPAQAAPRVAPFPGLREPALTAHAITGAKLVVSPDRTIENGTIVFRDGVITAVGENVTPPADAQV